MRVRSTPSDLVPAMEIYRNRAWRVRGLMWGMVVFAAFMLSFSEGFLRNYGLGYGEGGVLRPLGQRLLMAAWPAAIGLGALAGMWVYGRRCYVSALRWLPGRDAIEVETIGWFGYPRRTIPLSRLRGGEMVVENFFGNAGRQTVMWDALRLRGRRFPLILDFSGEVLDERAYNALLEGRAPDALPAPAPGPTTAKPHRDMTSTRRKRHRRRR